MAMADAETIGRRDRGADPGLGVAHRVSNSSPFARPAAMAEDKEQPVPWVFWVAMRGAASATMLWPLTR